jgi:hypothetical protein
MLNDALRHRICFLFESEEPINQARGGGSKDEVFPSPDRRKDNGKRQLRY